MMRPEFPITVTFHEDGDVWVLNSIEEVASSLEWFDSEDPTQRATVTDREGRAVHLQVKKLDVLVFELRQEDRGEIS